MPKVSKPRKSSRLNPLARTNGNIIKKEPSPESKPAMEPKDESANNANIKNEPETSPSGIVLPSTSGMTYPEPPEPKKRPADTKPDDRNYLLLCVLAGTCDPEISRLLSVSPSLSFFKFHEALQIAFGWTGSHMWKLDVFRAPQDNSGLHYRWCDELLSLSEMSERGRAVMPSPQIHRHASDWTLADVYDNEYFGTGVNMRYEYDMGDGWIHLITLIGREEPNSIRKYIGVPDDQLVTCLSGQGHACAEDVGSYEGWEDLKELFKHPRRKDEDDRKQWYKEDCYNGDPRGLNPYDWDIVEVNPDLAGITMD